MKGRRAFVLVGVGALAWCLGGCTGEEPTWKVKKRYFGLASHYGPEWEGRLTATGETFHNSELTAAHKSLPFGSKVRVTLLSTHKSVVVRINDRGPYVKGREIDLSDEAARRLGIGRKGVVEVLIEVLELGHDKYISPAKRRAMKKKNASKAKASSRKKPTAKELEALI
ncbi:septal ring lytic transglycosylase RlpA family protein [Nitratifractor sp.]|uniref:septal ring lytic transglycosylase RlpA family protein n=1 Tax=Nitratifractor sp. TaxID=2268144 RepID=UPI0025F9A749|nr:septal ring lytic transglycosylase RlpA family protein [Nitratifractor sp.]